MSAPLPIVKGFRFYSKGSLKGFFDCQLPSGMIATGCQLHETNGRFWIGLPARSYVNAEGEQAWCRIIDFVDKETRGRFQGLVVPLARAALAEAQKQGAA